MGTSRVASTRASVGLPDRIVGRIIVLLCWGAAAACPAAAGNIYYVNPTGANGEYSKIQSALNAAYAGDTIIVRDGTYSEYLDTVRAGTAANPITLRAENPRGVTVTRDGSILKVDQPYYTVEGIVFDGQYGYGDLVSVTTGGSNLIFRDNAVRRGAADGIDMGVNGGLSLGPHNVLIEGCVIHDLLYWTGGGREDAHGIVTGGVTNLTIRGTEIYYVSGDALQTQYGGWNNVLVEGCRFWNGPLPTARAGFPAGANPGENAIDTKEGPTEIRSAMTIRDCVFYGWAGDYIGNAAALNLKQNVTVLVDGNTLYGNEIAMRLRGAAGDTGAHVTVINNVCYGNEWAIRYEDNIQQLLVYNNTFDEGSAANDGIFASPDYPPLTTGFLNNLFLLTGAKPPEAANASNLAVTAGSFVDAAGHDYHLLASSPAIDAGLNLLAAGVTTDRDGNPRYFGAGFDVGAYEAPAPAALLRRRPGGRRLGRGAEGR